MGSYAQNQKIDPTVEVNKEYQGKMLEITKGKLGTEVADSIGIFNLNFNYSFFEKPYKDMYEFSAVPSAAIPKEVSASAPSFIARAGLGYPFAPEAAIWYAPQLEGNNWLKLKGWGDWYNGNVPDITINDESITEKSGEKVDGKEYSYGVSGRYTHAWKSAELSMHGLFHGGYNTYYGGDIAPDNPSSHHNFSIVEGGVDAKSSGAGKYGKRLNWTVKGLIRHASDKQSAKLQENYGSLAAELGPTFGRYNKFMVGADAEAVQYRGTTAYHMGIFGITPQYRYENGNLKINLGIKLQGKFASGGNNGNHSWILPAVDLSLGLVPGKLWLYAKADGRNSLNEYSSLLAVNRYMNPAGPLDGIGESSVPLNVEGGFKGRFTDKFSYKVFAAYTVHKGMMQFLYNCNEGWFHAENRSRHNETAVGGELDVATQNFRGGIGIRYSSFSKDTHSEPVTGIPALQGNMYLRYNWNGRFYAEAECRLQGEYNFRYTCAGTPAESGYYTAHTAVAPAFADLQATLGYVHSPALTFWLRGDNILNSATQYLPFHMGKGVGILTGIIVKL